MIGARLDRLKSLQGHVVVRVTPGGGTFQVIVLDDTGRDIPRESGLGSLPVAVGQACLLDR